MEPQTPESLDLNHRADEPQKPEPGEIVAPPEALPPGPADKESWLRWMFLGPQGLRAGWSVLIFVVVYVVAAIATGVVLTTLHLVNPKLGFTPRSVFFNELVLFVGLLVAAPVTALIERRRMIDYNLGGLRRTRYFFAGLAVGFAALSILVGGLAAGHWLRFGGPTLSAAAVLGYALFWGCVFLMTGCVEEGTFRCYLQYTLTRGINFWWALGLEALVCAGLAVRHKGLEMWGVYVIALLGLVPCFILHRRAAAHSAFWQAAWVTSTFFGFLHTGNGGENWVGIFSAAAIGFVFCVSIRVTGSAWWAIGCHAGWDWAETYFYGTADSGLVPQGHFLSTAPAGNPLLSGGSDGPEGSLLILGILALLMIWLVVVYGRRTSAQSDRAPEPAAR